MPRLQHPLLLLLLGGLCVAFAADPVASLADPPSPQPLSQFRALAVQFMGAFMVYADAPNQKLRVDAIEGLASNGGAWTLTVPQHPLFVTQVSDIFVQVAKQHLYRYDRASQYVSVSSSGPNGTTIWRCNASAISGPAPPLPPIKCDAFPLRFRPLSRPVR